MGDLLENGTLENGEKIVPMRREMFPNLSGRSARKLKRANTVHLDGMCPACGGRARFCRDIPIASDKVVHNRWRCNNCGKIWNREEFKYVKRS